MSIFNRGENCPATPKHHGGLCSGYVKPGRRFCWIHDPEIQTPELKAEMKRRRYGPKVRRPPSHRAGWYEHAAMVALVP